MAVEVSVLQVNGQVRSTTHANGHVLLVREGHLIVQSHPSSSAEATVAVYAPGVWRDAGLVTE